jgi:hypothetical protein
MYGARVKIARAHAHLLELDRLIIKHAETNPYRITQHLNEEEQSQSYIIEIDGHPVTMGLAFGDCIHNLRSGLDLLAVELTRLGLEREGKQMSSTKLDKAGFLIVANRENFEAKFTESTQHWSDAAKDYFLKLEPFNGGGHAFSDTLWHLHKLDILDKHKLLLVAATFPADMGVWVKPTAEAANDSSRTFTAEIRAGVMASGPGTPLKSGDVLFTVLSADPELQLQIRGKIGIGLRDNKIIEGKSVMEALNSMIGAADSVVETMATLG